MLIWEERRNLGLSVTRKRKKISCGRTEQMEIVGVLPMGMVQGVESLEGAWVLARQWESPLRIVALCSRCNEGHPDPVGRVLQI